jgi:hypothetical protein
MGKTAGPDQVKSFGMIEKGQKRASGKPKLYTPRAKQTRVIASFLAGKNKIEISSSVHCPFSSW